MKEALVKYLNCKNLFDFNAIVIRGADSESHLNGDIDVLVDHGFSNHACYILMNFLRDKGWKIINFRELDYLSSIIVVNPELFPGSAVKIDFFNGLGWYGVQSKSIDLNRFFEAKEELLQSAITLAHKIIYAGKFSERDIKRVKPRLNESLKLLNLDETYLDIIISTPKIPSLTKWKIRFSLSGYPKYAFPVWFIKILFFNFRSKIYPFRNEGKHIKIVTSKNMSSFIHDQLLELYKTSGDKTLPTFNNFFIKKITNL